MKTYAELDETLVNWLNEMEEIELHHGFLRVWSDQSHGFYVDVFPDNRCINVFGEEWIDDPKIISGLISDCRRGSDYTMSEFNQILFAR